jgi:hypothetical protein
MTIQRQYVLPNCSLALEGLTTDQADTVLSILTNVECKIEGIDPPLSGGLEFFKALTEAVSQYVQGLLSGLPHPLHKQSVMSAVYLRPGDGQYHHLVVNPPAEEQLNQTAGVEPIDIRLSTVQLFDLAEAVDQFFADTQTLPDLQPNLAPLSRRYVRPTEPVAQRITPPLIGLGLLSAAAVGLLWLPIPEVRETTSSPVQSATPAAGEPPSGASPSPTGSPAGSPVDAATAATALERSLNQAQPITDAAQLASLGGQLQQALSAGAPAQVKQALTYQVAVNDRGDVIGYRYENDAALANVDQTPLPRLMVGQAAAAAVAQFRVSFTPQGVVSVEPWSASQASPAAAAPEVTPTAETSPTATTPPEPTATAAGPSSPSEPPAAVGSLSPSIIREIEDADQIANLNARLRRTIIERRETRTFPDALTYRVRLAADGRIVGYEGVDQISRASVAETPLTNLVQSASADTPQVDFKLVITDRGIVEVSPWNGWR